jgi:hypothetical protein
MPKIRKIVNVIFNICLCFNWSRHAFVAQDMLYKTVHDFGFKSKGDYYSQNMFCMCGFDCTKEVVVTLNPIASLQAQLLADMERFGNLMHRYNLGDTSAKIERDELEGAVEIKLAILEGLKRIEEEEMAFNDDLMDEDIEVLEDIEEDEEW